MAKTSFTKLGLKENKSTVEVPFKDSIIEVKQYIPIREKLDILSNVVSKSLADEARYFNNIKVDMYLSLELIYHCTNISFTEKQKEDEPKLYDLMKGNGIMELILSVIPERVQMFNYTYAVLAEVYKYQDSVLGILDTISTDYSNLNFDMTKLQEQISDPNVLKLLKQVGPMIGLN